MNAETASRKCTNGAPTAPSKHRHNVVFSDVEMAAVKAAAKRAHLPIATYMRVVVLRDAEASR